MRKGWTFVALLRTDCRVPNILCPPRHQIHYQSQERSVFVAFGIPSNIVHLLFPPNPSLVPELNCIVCILSIADVRINARSIRRNVSASSYHHYLPLIINRKISRAMKQVR